MSKRISIVNGFYNEIDEDVRLGRSRQGQLEYLTTMEYIHRYAKPGDRILEIGAGTGRYSIALAKEGYDVTAVELVESNLEVMRKNGEGLEKLHILQGDATDLSKLENEAYDITLSFGPLYHLYEKQDIASAISEEFRVTRKDGIIFSAFLSVYAIMYDNYLNENLVAGIDENYDENFNVRHFENQLFTGYDICEFEALFEDRPKEYLKTIGVDSILELAEQGKNFVMSDSDFAAFAEYHLAICEKRELLGSSSHLLYICRKK